MWDLPHPGIEPVFPALAGGFFTTEPPGKPLKYSLCKKKKVETEVLFAKLLKNM